MAGNGGVLQLDIGGGRVDEYDSSFSVQETAYFLLEQDLRLSTEWEISLQDVEAIVLGVVQDIPIFEISSAAHRDEVLVLLAHRQLAWTQVHFILVFLSIF